VQRRRDRVLHVHHVFVAQTIELAGRDAGNDMRRNVVEDLGRKHACDPHLGAVFAGLQRYGHESGS
jgi:hypothetical protein